MLVHYVVAYDVSDSKRLKKVYDTLRDFGDPIQYSVFECQISERNLLILRDRLSKIVVKDADRIIFIRLGPVSDSTVSAFETMGCQFAPRDRRVQVV